MHFLNWLNNWSFGWKMGAAMVLLGILPLIVTGLLPTNAASSLENQSFDQLAALAEIKALSVGNWLDERLGDMHQLSDQQVLRGNAEGDEGVAVMSAHKQDRASAEFQYAHARALSAMQELAAIHADEYSDVMLFDLDGDNMAQTNPEDAATRLEDNVADREFFIQGMKGLYVTDVAFYEVSGEAEMFIAKPLQNVRGQTVGVLVLQIKLDSLNTLMGERTGLGRTGETYLVGPDHLFRSESRFLDDLGTASTITNPEFPVNTQAADRALAGETGIELIDDYRGVPVMSAYHPIAIRAGSETLDFTPLNWALIAEIDEDEVLAPANEQRQIDLIAAGLAALAAAGVAFLLTWLMTRQVREIETVFAEVRIGEFDTRAKIFSQDELGQTAEGINALLDLFNNLLEDTEAEAQERIRTMALLGWAWEVDKNWTFTYCSESITDVLGYGVDEVIGHSLFDFALAGEVERVKPELNALARKRQTITEVECWNRHQNGAEVCLLLNGLPIVDGDGNLTGYRGAAKDITGAKRAEATIRENEQRYRTVADFAYAWEYWQGPENSLYYVSPACERLTGYTPVEFIANPALIERLILPDDMRVWRDHRHEAAQYPGLHGAQFRIRRKDGAVRWIEHSCQAVTDADGRAMGFRSSNRDITDQKRVIRDMETAVAQVTDTSSAMAEIIQLMVDQAAHSTKMAEQATVSAQQGDDAVSETIAAMTRIRDNTQETARSIKRLGEVSQEISEIVRLIEDLADRTTVLALNASIQAAAAGDAGRGFAVVAEEVQRLAERATGATRDIEHLVKNIQAETNEAVVNIEDATREVADGSRLAQQAGQRMVELNDLVGQLAGLIQQTTETTMTQTGGSVAALVDLSVNLQESVAAFGAGSPGEPGYRYGNGHDRAASAATQTES